MTDTIEADETVTAAENLLTAGQDVAVRDEGAVQSANEGSSVAAQVAMAMIQLSRRDGHIDVETLRELRGMAKEMRDEERIAAFARDMAELQSELQPVVRSAEAKMITKDGENKGSWFHAPREKIMAMLQPLASKYGFSLTHDHKPRQGDGGGFEVITTCWHRSGHTITASFPLPLDTGPGRNNLQAAGSTVEYGEKYNTLSLFNIVRKGADDDGVSAGGRNLTKEQAADIKALVSESEVDPKEWLALQLNYPVKQYLDIVQEDYVRLKRALLSIVAAKEQSKTQGMKL